MALKILVERRHALKLSIISILYPLGEPILPHLLRYRAFAVDDHSCIPCALHPQQAWLVNNPRSPESFIKISDIPVDPLFDTDK